jgi:hypothetical protein
VVAAVAIAAEVVLRVVVETAKVVVAAAHKGAAVVKDAVEWEADAAVAVQAVIAKTDKADVGGRQPFLIC